MFFLHHHYNFKVVHSWMEGKNMQNDQFYSLWVEIISRFSLLMVTVIVCKISHSTVSPNAWNFEIFFKPDKSNGTQNRPIYFIRNLKDISNHVEGNGTKNFYCIRNGDILTFPSTMVNVMVHLILLRTRRWNFKVFINSRWM